MRRLLAVLPFPRMRQQLHSLIGMRALPLLLCLVVSGCAIDGRSRAVRSPSSYTITLIELYTPDAVAANGGEPARVEEKIRAAVANLNGDLTNSAIYGIRFVAVYVGMMDFGGKRDGALLDAAMADSRVAALRGQYAADLVGVWSGGGGGIATQTNPDAPISLAAYHVIPSDQPIDTHLLSHEIGHNMGIQHADYDPSNPYGWGRGICRQEFPPFRDVMGGCSGQPTLPPLARLFSNPDVLYNGVPTGTSDRNGAAMIRLTAPQVSTYR